MVIVIVKLKKIEFLTKLQNINLANFKEKPLMFDGHKKSISPLQMI